MRPRTNAISAWNRLPSSVSLINRFARSKSWVPSHNSSSWICLLIAPCVTNSSWPAKVKLRWRAAASKDRSVFSGGSKRIIRSTKTSVPPQAWVLWIMKSKPNKNHILRNLLSQPYSLFLASCLLPLATSMRTAAVLHNGGIPSVHFDFFYLAHTDQFGEHVAIKNEFVSRHSRERNGDEVPLLFVVRLNADVLKPGAVLTEQAA